MSRFATYIKTQAPMLKAQFQQIRGALSDSSVKGSSNEQVVAEFLRQNIAQSFISTNCQAVDSYDAASDEVDVCVCNEYQPFKTTVGGLQIVEGVDFVVQVKAIMTSLEIDRSLKNCKSIKKLKCQFGKGDQVYEPVGVRTEDYHRVPYVIFAFSSELKPQTILNKVIEKCNGVDPSMQPDALFVLELGLMFRNFRDGAGNPWSSDNAPLQGWLGWDTGDATLFELLRFAAASVPKFIRHRQPLRPYFDSVIDYTVVVNDGAGAA